MTHNSSTEVNGRIGRARTFRANGTTTIAEPPNATGASQIGRGPTTQRKRSKLEAATESELQQLHRLNSGSRLVVPITGGQASRLRRIGIDALGYFDDVRNLDAAQFMDLLIPYDGSIDGEKNASVIAADADSAGTIPFRSRVSISARSSPFRTSPTTWKRRRNPTPS